MISYFFYRIAESLALLLPLRLAYTFATVLSYIYYIFAFRDRREVTANLKSIFPDKPGRDIATMRFQVFRNFAKYLVDFLRFKKINESYIRENIKLVNFEHIQEGLRRGKGVIILTAHLGNWELGGVVVSSLGYPLVSVALPHKSREVNRFFNEKRESKGLKILSLGSAAKSCLRALRQNQLLALLGDRVFAEKGRVVEFFGRPTLLPEGTAVLALQTQAAVVPGFMLRNPDDTFSLIFEKPIDFTLSKEREKNVEAIMIKCKEVFERYIRSYPQQWYMFRRFWEE